MNYKFIVFHFLNVDTGYSKFLIYSVPSFNLNYYAKLFIDYSLSFLKSASLLKWILLLANVKSISLIRIYEVNDIPNNSPPLQEIVVIDDYFSGNYHSKIYLSLLSSYN